MNENNPIFKSVQNVLIGKRLPAILATFLVGAIFIYWIFGGGSAVESHETVDFSLSNTTVAKLTGGHDHSGLDSHDHGGSGASLFACPMMCVPPMSEPGKCPVCGMDLVPVPTAAKEETAHNPVIRLSSEAVERSKIQVARVQKKAVRAEVRMFGRVAYDPAHKTEITAFMPGVIDRLYVRRAGQFVRWGDPLFDVYSTDLLDAQEQLLKALEFVPPYLAFQSSQPHAARDAPIVPRKMVEEGDEEEHSKEVEEALNTIAAIRHKLGILGVPKRDIDEFMKKGGATGIATVYASMYGQVAEINASEGAFVNTGTPLVTLADPEFIWAELEAYETDYPWIRKGQRLHFTVEAFPGERFPARVVFIDPVFNTKTRTFKIGALCTADTGGRLKAGMMIRAVLEAGLDSDGGVVDPMRDGDKHPLVIPASAPLITGTRAVVYVRDEEDEGKYEGREIVLGPRAKDYYVVRSGLAEGEQVVVNGAFKIDSALQIVAKPSLMNPSDDHSMHSGYTDHDNEPSEMEEHSSSALVHHYRNRANNLNKSYQDERIKSRMNSERLTDQAILDRFGERTAQPQRENNIRSRMTRRKPGRYGDTTRQSTTNLKDRSVR